MLLKLIKIREMNSGAHCEVWEANLLMGDNFLARVFVLNEHLPLELIYQDLDEDELPEEPYEEPEYA